MKLDWKRLLSFRRDGVFGLDIGSSAVKIVRLCKDNTGYAVTEAGVVDIPSSEDDDNRREINTVRAVRDCVQLTGIQTKMAVCSVCGSEVAVRNFRFPSLPPEEIKPAVLLEAGQVCPFNAEDSAVDYQLTSGPDDNLRGFLVAATNTVLTSKVQLVRNASLNCVLMDIDGLALVNCFNEFETPQSDRATPILNIGSSYTTLAIAGGNDLPFVRDIGHAGDEIVARIAAENDMSTETVKEILFGDSTEARLKLRDSLEKACEELIVDVNETLRYYTAHKKTGIAQRIFVCGGLALVKDFVDLLGSRLPAEVVLWNPFDKIRCKAGSPHRDMLRQKGPVMAVAAGLAMRSI